MTERLSRLSATLALSVSCAFTFATPAMIVALPEPAPGSASADPVGEAFRKLRADIAPALVTVKFLLKVDAHGQMSEYLGQYGDQGQSVEATGIMIEPDGLVLIANSKLGGIFGGMSSGSGSAGGIITTPTDIRILTPDDPLGLSARLIARDSELDLAWLRIDDEKLTAAPKVFPSINLSTSAKADIGDRLISVQRLPRFYDRAPHIEEGRVGGATEKPRSLLTTSGLIVEPGTPVFTIEGKLVGVGVLQLPAREDLEGGDSDDAGAGLLPGLGFAGVGTVILPAAEVMKATEKAKQRVQQQPEGEAAKGKATP